MTKPVDPTLDVPAQSKDSRVKAVVFMNLFSFSQAWVSIIFKFCNKNGVSVMEWMLWRNVFNFLVITVILKYLKVSVIKDAPK
jgi:hypothetical protein